MKFNIFQRTSREVKKAEARLGPKVGPKAKGKWSPDAHASKVKNGANEDENLENLAAYPGEFHPHEAFCLLNMHLNAVHCPSVCQISVIDFVSAKTMAFYMEQHY